MRAALLTRFQWRTLGAMGGALLTLVRLVKNQWRIGVRHLGFYNGAPMAHRAPTALAGPKDGTSPTDQRNQDHGARKKRAALIALATCGKFTLYERAGRARDGWRSLKLVRDPREAGQNSWHLGWNGTRMARNTDAVKLIDDHPETMQWVIDTLREGVIDAQRTHGRQ